MTDPQNTIPDLRPQLTRAQQWVLEIIGGVQPEQLDHPTPCDDFGVRTLIAHLCTATRKIEVLGSGGDIRTVQPITELAADPAAGYSELAEASQRAWAAADLRALVTAPWGMVPSGFALGGYLNETLAHGWDLAVATGQPSEADDDLAVTALATMQKALPAQPRGGNIPFGPVIESAPDATPTERLVNWTGRRTADWQARVA